MTAKIVRNGNQVELDVREILEKGDDPFQEIMQAVETLKKEDIFLLHANFRPDPLLSVMKNKGFKNQVEKKAEKHYQVTFTRE